MNKALIKEYIDKQPIKIVTKLDLGREKLEYDKIVQCQKRTDAKPEELLSAFRLLVAKMFLLNRILTMIGKVK